MMRMSVSSGNPVRRTAEALLLHVVTAARIIPEPNGTSNNQVDIKLKHGIILRTMTRTACSAPPSPLRNKKYPNCSAMAIGDVTLPLFLPHSVEYHIHVLKDSGHLGYTVAQAKSIEAGKRMFPTVVLCIEGADYASLNWHQRHHRYAAVGHCLYLQSVHVRTSFPAIGQKVVQMCPG